MSGLSVNQADDYGRVRVFQLSSSSVDAEWIPIGNDVVGEKAREGAGSHVALSADGSILAVTVARLSEDFVGGARMFRFNGTEWTQQGGTIVGVVPYDIKLSSDGSTVAVSDRDASNYQYGRVRVFERTEGEGSSWTQVGLDMVGERSNERQGFSISISSDGSRIAVGAPGFGWTDSVGDSGGFVRILQYDGTDWSPVGEDIIGASGRSSEGDMAGFLLHYPQMD